ncbi:NAD-dependent succinate-semialdehyde dehydrogenase [Comamonas aquatica]|uniref:NAD-dependent succinate-semialdehyde dehydrogenase n=1 Tax=Comamonas aquatica TaxID=225991 RepID=UPI001B386D03|nr:NAD-dependent succinate-semialdehyde dehydrogenase [Comamonas aquatica]QTX22707.1 NAD-dependent succinate-semialdehyde dehydrogenase [Comamonas aquatica]
MPQTNHEVQLLIDGQWRSAASGKTIEVRNPANGVVIGHVAHSDVVDLDAALQAAQKGFGIWRNMPAIERSAIMRRAAGLLRERADSIAALMTQEQGKPLAEAKAEVLAGVGIIEWFADEAIRVYGRIVPARRMDVQQLVIKEPVGVVAAFTPWNFPVNQIVRKLGAALSTGCAFLCKAPEETPASPAALLECFVDAGIPAGVVGLVYGNPAQISEYLIAHPIIKKITFTGSTQVGKQLAALAGKHMKRCTMELGGHAPVIVAEDADVALAVQASSASKFRNAGQVCIAPTRFLVHRSIQTQFTQAMLDRVAQIQVGDGMNVRSSMGALANSRRITAMEQVVQDAQHKGAKLLAGGTKLGEVGNFFAPTVLADVPLDADVFNNEPFGPVVSMRSFDKLEEAIAEANRLPYGLAAYAFTSSLKTAHTLTHQLETGMLWINQPAVASAEMPFGGVKDSGYGSEGGPEALEAYLVSKAVSIAMV